MFDLSALLTKPLLAVILALSTACVALAGYSWYQVKQKDKLADTLAVTQMQLFNLNNRAKIERELYTKTLSALQQREVETKYVVSENNELRAKLRGILRDEKDVCLNSRLPDAVIGLLATPKSDS